MPKEEDPASRTQHDASLPDLPPVEFELLTDSHRFDVAHDPIVLADGRRIEVTTKPFWTYSALSRPGGPHLSLTYAPALRVTAIPTGGVKLGTRDAVAEVAVAWSDLDAAEGLESMVNGLSSAVAGVSTEPTVYRVLGSDVQGTRVRTVGPTIDLLAVQVGEHRQLRVLVTSTTPDADLTQLRAALETLKLGERSPTSQFAIAMRDQAGVVVTADATIGVPVLVGAKKMTVARRATVREQLRTMRFEHSPALTARFSNSVYPSVGMYFGSVTIHVILLPHAFTHSELLVGLSIPIVGGRLFSRTINDVEYWGTAGTLNVGSIDLRTQVFSFERDGRHFAVSINAPPGDVARANELADTVIASLR